MGCPSAPRSSVALRSAGVALVRSSRRVRRRAPVAAVGVRFVAWRLSELSRPRQAWIAVVDRPDRLVVVGREAAGVVTVTVVGVITPDVVPAEPVLPSDGAVLEQNGTPVLGLVVAVGVVLVLDTGSVVVFVL